MPLLGPSRMRFGLSVEVVIETEPLGSSRQTKTRLLGSTVVVPLASPKLLFGRRIV
jgi:hypothetical protein